MNLGGVKVSSRELEVVLDHHPAVYEAAAVGVPPAGGGADRLVVFAVLKDDVPADDLRAELQREISEHLNPLFRIHDLVVVDSLPRTASNKLMRRELRGAYDG
jgi:acetyl-CoA synthetase